MPKAALLFLDGFFFVFHTALVLFNVFGWLWKRTRIWNLVCLALTAISWFLMGLWKGAGYCICTDWHWKVREALGVHERSDTYIQMLVHSLTGWVAPSNLVETVTGGIFVVCVVGSVVLNIRDYRLSLAAKREDSDLGRAR